MRGRACERTSSSLEKEVEPDRFQKALPAMVAIAAILVFIIAIGALNWFEFGRVD